MAKSCYWCGKKVDELFLCIGCDEEFCSDCMFLEYDNCYNCYLEEAYEVLIDGNEY